MAGLAVPVLAEQQDEEISQTVGMSGGERLVSTSRFTRPVSKIAENVTVITSEDIKRINAHTLTEVLQSIPGVQLDQIQTPGNFAFYNILSSTSRHVLLQIDGVPQNFLSTDYIALPGSIPVQHIERVEIIKGAASTVWGSALGGVVNVITKSPESERVFSGTASASYGDRTTSDLKGEVSGTKDRLGYYLSGGKIFSHGFTPGTPANLRYGFGKLTYSLPNYGTLTFGIDVRDNSYGLEDVAAKNYHDYGGERYLSTYLNLKCRLADRLTLEMLGHIGRRELATKWGELDSPTLYKDTVVKENPHGLKLNLLWGDSERSLAAGLEYGHTAISQRDLINTDTINNYDHTLDSWAAYLNGTYSYGPLTILPGLRLDHYNLFDDALSYSLGATLRLSNDTILRSYAARGYSLPVVNSLAISNGVSKLQDIWTVQVGIETEAIPYLWLKGMLFYNDTWNIQNFDTSTSPATITLQEEIKQGFELEARTTPLYGVALAGSYNYTFAKDYSTGQELDGTNGSPRQGAKLALNYDNKNLGTRGTVSANYVWWKPIDSSEATHRSMVWDLHLTQKLLPKENLSPELFFSVRNLFNGAQYQSEMRPNAPRWIEGGVRFKF